MCQAAGVYRLGSDCSCAGAGQQAGPIPPAVMAHDEAVSRMRATREHELNAHLAKPPACGPEMAAVEGPGIHSNAHKSRFEDEGWLRSTC